MPLGKKEEELLKLIVKNSTMGDTQLATKLNISEEELRKLRSKIGGKAYTNLKKEVKRYYK